MAQTRQIKKLDELMDGALTERFNYEMERVLNNVFDPNTNPKAKRQIQIVIDIVPNERREEHEPPPHGCQHGHEVVRETPLLLLGGHRHRRTVHDTAIAQR